MAAAALALLGTLLILVLHWVVLTISSLDAPPLRRTCVAPCQDDRTFNFGGWTFFLLLPELSLVAGLATVIARRRARPYAYAFIAAIAALVIVTVALFSDRDLRHALPPGPAFGIESR
ncbi:MAG TPA: hypothetical protein VF101_11905 [Gaiellaceae bacterium]